MKKLFTLLIALSMIFAVNAADKFAYSNITWADGPWYNLATGGTTTTAPVSGDNVFTQGYVITVSADATCDNFTIGTAQSANSIIIGAGITLTVRGTIDCATNYSVDVFGSGMNATAILKLTGAALTGTAPYILITDNAIQSIRPKNLTIDNNDGRSYKFTAGTTSNHFTMPNSSTAYSGKFRITGGTNFTLAKNANLGNGTENELIVEENAIFTTQTQVRGSNSGTNAQLTKATINGTVNHTGGGFTIKDLILGASGKLVTSANNRINPKGVEIWDGWWGDNSSNYSTIGEIGTPASVTLAAGSTIEFSRAGAQNINGIVPTNTLVRYSNLVVPTYSIEYSNLKISGGNTKTIQSNLTYSGTFTVVSGTTLALAPNVTLAKASGYSIRISNPIPTVVKYLVGSGPSNVGSFNITATGLSGDVTVANSGNYQVSSDNSTWGTTATLTPASGSLTNIPVYYRLKSAIGKNNYIENIAISGGGLEVPVNAVVTGVVYDATTTAYTWDGGGGADTKWTTASNWNPDRSTPNMLDVLTFNSSATVTDVPTQTIAQLKLNSPASVTLSSANSQVLSIIGDAGDDLSVASGSSLIMSTNANINLLAGTSGDISGTLTNAVSLNLSSGAQLTNSGTITNNGTINLLSDPINGTATITGSGTISGTGKVSVNQYLRDARNNYITSPVTVATSTAQSGYTWYERNEVASTWPSVSTGASLTVGKGYIAMPRLSGATIMFSGTLNSGNVTVALTKSGSGFNLIGNPYPSNLKWENAFVVDVTNAALIEPSIYVRTNAGTANNSGLWSFLTYNASTGLTVPSYSILSGGIIPPMQAFWVKAKAAGNLILDNKLTRMHQTSNPLKAPAIKNSDRQLVRLQVSNGVKTDETLLFFDANALNSYDRFDTPKFADATPDLELFTTVGNEKLVMNGMNSMSLNTPIGLGFVAGNGTAFSIKANEISNIPQGVKVILKDNVSNAETDLTDGTAIYNFAPATTSTDRFSIIFRTAGNATGVNDVVLPTAEVFVNANNQIVINAVEKSNYAIYNAVGKLLENGVTASNLQTSIPIAIGIKLNAGVYFVKINALTTKVIIK